MMLLAARGAIRSSGAGLPYDAEVEYLESSGTQWIDTGVYATENTRVKATLMTISTGNKNWFGGAASGYTGFAVNSYSSTQIEYYFGNGGWKRASGTDLVNRVFTLEFSKSSVSIDGVSVATPSYTSFPTQTSPITIFVRYGGAAYINGRVYGFKIYDGETLVRDYIPVRRGTVGYLYDRVSKRLFGNAGTGDFVLGPDVVPVEYIESHGTEYIDTGVTSGPSNLEFTIDCTITNTIGTTQSSWTGSGVNSIGGLHYVLDQDGIRTGGGSVTNSIPYTSGKRVQIRTYYDEQNRRNVQVGDRYYYGSAYSAPTANLCLLRMVQLANQSGLFFGATVSQSGAPVRSFRPVRVGTEGAMMDVLTRRIYRNQGSGAFTFGNDLRYPIPA